MPGSITAEVCHTESADVRGHFARLKAAGATVVLEPYSPWGAGPLDRWAREAGFAPEVSICACIPVGQSRYRPPPPGSRGRRLGGTAVAMPWAIGPVPRQRRSTGLALTTTADASRGAANLLTRPRAGNISSDTRAGVDGRWATRGRPSARTTEP